MGGPCRSIERVRCYRVRTQRPIWQRHHGLSDSVGTISRPRSQVQGPRPFPTPTKADSRRRQLGISEVVSTRGAGIGDAVGRGGADRYRRRSLPRHRRRRRLPDGHRDHDRRQRGGGVPRRVHGAVQHRPSVAHGVDVQAQPHHPGGPGRLGTARPLPLPRRPRAGGALRFADRRRGGQVRPLPLGGVPMPCPSSPTAPAGWPATSSSASTQATMSATSSASSTEPPGTGPASSGSSR